MNVPAIEARGLGKTFGDTVALDGLDLTVGAGQVCALLGRNGAGKTTAVRVLTTLVRPDSGVAMVAGFDVARQPAQVRARIGLAGQSSTMDELLSGQENLEVIGRLLRLRPRLARLRAAQALEEFQLTAAGRRQVATYSGGMRRRLDLAASLLVRPQVLFLDEPTTGLDPTSRAQVWDAVRAVVAEGSTVLLTTQYLEEADQLADSVVVVDRGRVRAVGMPDQLKDLVGSVGVRLVVADPADAAAVAQLVELELGVRARVNAREVTAPAPDGVDSLADLLAAARRRGLALTDAAMDRPSLDDVFHHLTRAPSPGALDGEPVR